MAVANGWAFRPHLTKTIRAAGLVAATKGQAYQKHNRCVLQMGGYYVEAEEEEAKNIIDRSKTHMTFGIRCKEEKLQISIPSPSSSSGNSAITKTVVGLVPLVDDAIDKEAEEESFVFSFDDVKDDENVEPTNARTVSRLMNLLFHSEYGDDEESSPSWTLVEIGADPIFPLAVAEWMEAVGSEQKIVTNVIVKHSDEQRLRVLEHAHLFFNQRKPKSSSTLTFSTKPLTDDSNPWIETLQKGTNNKIVVLISNEKFATQLLDKMKENANPTANPAGDFVYRTIIPSTIMSREKLLLDGFQCQSVGFGDENGDDGLDFWEIVPIRQ